MDFFEHQDVARRKTGRMVVYFCLAVILIITAVYLVTAFAASTIQWGHEPLEDPTFKIWDPQLAAGVAVVMLLVIALGSLYKISLLSSGGAAVAEALGGRRIERGTSDLDQQVVLNVVEEMAIASGTPVPPVYLLEGEEGINAFAAGLKPEDAVIGVTRGCAQLLSRDELQGVIAHEFSHILNGDMRLNIRLIGVVHGILVVALAGFVLMHSVRHTSHRSTSRGGGGGVIAIVMFGVALCLIGYLGVFFGRLIKSAVSRQREFLADASAVQFTRNPGGISGALKKIAGLSHHSRVDSPHAEENSHMFFGNALKPAYFSAMATHPPLDMRIRRIDPTFDGKYPKVAAPHRSETDLHATGAELNRQKNSIEARRAAGRQPFPFQPAQAIDAIGAPGVDHFAYAAALIASMPTAVVDAVHEPFGARAVVYGLLLDRDPDICQQQLDQLNKDADPANFEQTAKLWQHREKISPEMRLPLFEMAMPALKNLSPPQYHKFRTNVTNLIKADGRVDIFEYALHRMLLGNLDGHFQVGKSAQRGPVKTKYHSLKPLLGACTDLLSKLAYVGHTEDAPAAEAFDQAIRQLLESDGEPPSIVPRSAVGLEKFDQALTKLAAASPAIKRRLLEAAATCIAADGKTTVEEAELLRVIADSLGCPMPPLLA